MNVQTLIDHLNRHASDDGCTGVQEESCFRAFPDDPSRLCSQCLAQETAKAIASMMADIDEADHLRERLTDLLRRTAIALKGPEPPLVMHDWSDLPEVATRKFWYDAPEAAKAEAWVKDHATPTGEPCTWQTSYQGAIGGVLTYSFTPTSIGTVHKVRCTCGAEMDVTDYEAW